MDSAVRLVDGSYDWSAGVDSGRVATVRSDTTPYGLSRSQLAWAWNATVRGGGILQRTGWTRLCTVHAGGALYQGGFLYDQTQQGGNPYLVLSIGGRIYRVRVDTDNSVDDITGDTRGTDNQNPAGIDQAYFVQGEEFLVIQAGDGETLPLFWDGETMRRSDGGVQLNLRRVETSFNAPAIGLAVEIDLYGAFRGYTNQIVIMSDNGALYMQVEHYQYYTVQNIDDEDVGSTIEAGEEVQIISTGATLGDLLVNFTVPAIGASVNIKIEEAYGGPPVPEDIRIGGSTYRITATGNAVPPADHEYFVNLGETAGTLHDATLAAFLLLLSIRELPAATAMDYYEGRIWYAQGRAYAAGDIIGGAFGTSAYGFRDAILKVTENPLAVGGDGFTVPSQAGNIRALKHSANIDTQLGQGQLFPFTNKVVYSMDVPISRANWISAGNEATGATDMPVQKVVQINSGSYGERGIVAVNGDLFYQAADGIRSLITAVRDFAEWGNTPISRNVNRAIVFNNRGLMRFASGMQFDNRLWQGCLPVQTNVGVACRGMLLLDFDLITSLAEKLQPAWEGMYEGLHWLQVFEGDYGGLQRAFFVVHSQEDESIQVWEASLTDRFDGDDKRVSWGFETPAWTWGKEWELKRLDGLEIWVDKLYGTVEMEIYWRPDADPCWRLWDKVTFCAARSTAEDIFSPVSYPEQPYCEGFKFPITLGKPPVQGCVPMSHRPAEVGFQHQLKVLIRGWCRIRGLLVYALPVARVPFPSVACSNSARPL